MDHAGFPFLQRPAAALLTRTRRVTNGPPHTGAPPVGQGGSRTPTAVPWARSSSTVPGPTITEATPARDSSQANVI
jgi:hypothetical protein